MDQQIKYLNSFSVLSFDVNNVYVSFQTKNYFFSNKEWVKNRFSLAKKVLKLKSVNYLQKSQFWIIKVKKQFLIKQINTYDQKQSLTKLNNILIGPFFDINSAKFILNTLQVK